MQPLKTTFLIASLSALSLTATRAEVRPHSLFSDHMVLQQERTTPLRGHATAGETIQVQWLGGQYTTTADSSGQWHIDLPAQPAGGPHQMVISGSASSDEVTIRDILIGEVWLASGQSNMEWPLSYSDEATRVTASEPQSQIRFYTVPKNPAATPAKDPQSAWVQAEPEAARRFSAVAYVFAKNISAELGVPVGIIQSTVGGTPVETWTPQETVKEHFPQLWQEREAVVTPFMELAQSRLAPGEQMDSAHLRAMAEAVEAQWVEKVGTLFEAPFEPEPDWFSSDFDAQDWTAIKLPGAIESQMGIDTEGSFWVRLTFRITPAQAGNPAGLRLGPIDDFDQTWLNGVKVGQTLRDTPFAWIRQRNYTVKPDILRQGENVLLVRVIDHNLTAGFFARPAEFYIETADGTRISLAGTALAKLETDIGKKMSLPANDWQFAASTVYDGMIAPLAPVAIRGVIWYQGENNISRAAHYHSQFTRLVESWRALWQEELPFYYAQLSAWGDPLDTPADSAIAQLREAQLKALDGSALGMAVTIDVGEAWDVHPRDKKTVGHRLAALALNRTYGLARADSGPLYQEMQTEGNAIRIRFSHTASGLIAAEVPATYPRRRDTNNLQPLVRNSPDSQLEGFAICGGNRQWHWADARIEGDTVVVSSPLVDNPVAVRYGWADYPFTNLRNSDGLPASPFRTDDFPAVTAVEE